MWRLLICLLALTILPTDSQAAAKIKRRIANRSPGFCMWVSTNMAGDCVGCPSIHNMAEWHFRYDKDGGAWPWELQAELAELNVAFRFTYHGDLKYLKEATDKGVPVVVTLGPRAWVEISMHAVVVYDVTATHVYFIDPNHPKDEYRYTHKEFLADWTRWGLVLFPDSWWYADKESHRSKLCIPLPVNLP